MDAFLVVRQFRPAVYAHRCREAAAAGLPVPDKAAGKQLITIGQFYSVLQ